jgi:proteasome lid subunit RPN8/RPN11
MKSRRQASLSQPVWDDDWLEEEDEPVTPALRFSPTAWAKLLYFRDKSSNEVGGFSITKPEDLLFVTDFLTVKQEVSCVSVKFDDEAVGRFFDEQVDLGRKPEQFARLWLHTHPGDSPEPSMTDEDTFRRVFGGCQWAVMFVLAQDGSTYARLSFNVGPGGQILIPTDVDYSQEFGPSSREAWDAEYAANISATEWPGLPLLKEPKPAEASAPACTLPYDFLSEFERMDPVQRQLILDELAERPELWDRESEVVIL